MSDATGSYVVLAEFSVADARRAEFLELCALDARSSVRDEPGCRQFEAHTVEGAADMVVLYEAYDDRAAFEAHLRTPHYAAFAAGVARLGVVERQVRFLARAGGPDATA